MRTPQCEGNIYLLADPSEEDPAHKDAGTPEIQKVSHRSMDRITGGSLMPIRKREFKNGAKWCVDVMLPNGKRYRRVVGVKKQAEQVQKRVEADIVEGKWDIRDKEDVPFSTLVAKYLEYAQANKSYKTHYCDKYRIRAHLLTYFKDTPLSLISSQLLDNYKSLRIREGASNNTVNHELVNLSHMMKMAIRWGYIEHNVVSTVEKMKVSKKAMRFLNQEEIRRLIEASRDSYIYPLIITALHTGMRKSELFNLAWSDINFDQHTVTVQSKSDWHTKNYRSRTLQLTPVLYEVLKAHRLLHLELGIQNDYVFTYQGNRIKTDICASLGTVMKKAGLIDVTLHTLRHTFASQLVMAGVSLKEVQELMGHQSFETTIQYVHLSDDHVKRQVLKLPFANG
jgi:integrase